MKWTGPGPLKGEVENVGGKNRKEAAPGKRVEIQPGEKIPNGFLHPSSIEAFKKKGWIDGKGKEAPASPPKTDNSSEEGSGKKGSDQK